MSRDVAGVSDAAGLVDVGEFALLGGAGRDAAFKSVQRDVCRLQALQAAMINEVDRTSSFVDDGHHSVTNWVAAVSNCSKGTARQTTRVAAMCNLLPLLAASVADGRVGADQIRVLAGLYANDRCRDQLPDSEELLVTLAITLTYRDFVQACQRWEAYADPDGAHADHEMSRNNRHVTSHRVGAGHVLHAEGDALTGEIVKNILDALADAEFHIDVAERLNRYGDLADQHPLARSAAQRRYDAFVKMAINSIPTTTVGRAATDEEPDPDTDTGETETEPDTATDVPSANAGGKTGGKCPTCGNGRTGSATDRAPLVNIFCTETVLCDAIRDFFQPDTTRQDNQTQVSERFRLCETAGGAPVDPHDLAIAALVGQIRRVVTDSAGRVIDLGRRSRLFTGAAREAVLLSGDRCTQPGCDLRIRGIQIDHLDAWAARGGRTNPFNGGVDCPKHNRNKHHTNITVTRDHTGWHYWRQDGTEIAPRG